MLTLFLTVLGASLLGSLHCAGMCGGFVAFYAGTDASTGWMRVQGHLAYHGGRLTTYAVLGAVAGTVGHAVDLAGSAAGLQSTAAIVAGLAMFGWGAVQLARVLGLRLPQLPHGSLLQRAYSGVLSKLRGRTPVGRALLLGLASTLLPCGWLYMFAITAAGTGHAGWGALVMAAFWVGTVPVLVGLAVGIQALAGPLRRHLPAISAVVLMVVGLVSVGTRVTMRAVPRAGAAAATAPADAKGAVDRVKGLKSGKAPCCNDEY